MKPTKAQLDFLEWEFGIFFHFGIRSFYPGHKDWDGLPMPAEAFDPKQLDCEQWITEAKNAGATYAILTAKHHDGFALWPSKYTEYSVANTPWKGGKGDVIAEFVRACRKHSMKVGLYYSPAQWGESAISFENAKEYDDYFINQIGELLTGYGKIDYLWFDGCGSEGHEYDRARIVREIFRMQPDILTFCDPEWTPGVRWVGNEDGYASLNNPLVVSSTDFSELATEEQLLSEAKFLPAECDCKIRSTWFYDYNEDTLKSKEELFGMYEMSVGHGSNFLLNIGPDDRGLLPEADVRRLGELVEMISAYKTPIEMSDPEQTGENEYSISIPEDQCRAWKTTPSVGVANRIVLMEDISEGQRVRAFKLYAHLPVYQKKKILIYEGRTIGHKLICSFGAVRGCKYTLEITDSDGAPKLRDMKAYYAKS
jgi:alpha-L-fucosidase